MLFIVVPFALFHIVAALSSAANGRAYTLDHERETGWLLFDASGWCDVCAEGFYSNASSAGADDGHCLPCPPYSASADESGRGATCACLPGHTDNATRTAFRNGKVESPIRILN